MMKRRKCAAEGCMKLGRNKGWHHGSKRYGKFCQFHHRSSPENGIPYYKEKQEIDNSVCSNCGWNEAPCDRHRIRKEAGYTQLNVVVLCPNCHRLAHLGLLKFEMGGSKRGG